MKRMSLSSQLAALACLLALAGCASLSGDNEYEPTWPEPVEETRTANGAIYQAGHDIALFETPWRDAWATL